MILFDLIIRDGDAINFNDELIRKQLKVSTFRPATSFQVVVAEAAVISSMTSEPPFPGVDSVDRNPRGCRTLVRGIPVRWRNRVEVRKVGKDSREEEVADVAEAGSAATVLRPHLLDICCTAPPRVLRN